MICWSRTLASICTYLPQCVALIFLRESGVRVCFAYRIRSQSRSLNSSSVPTGKKNPKQNTQQSLPALPENLALLASWKDAVWV